MRSGSRIAKRRVEAGGEAGPGPSGGGQVRDEMPPRGAGTPTKRRRSVLIGGVETEYVADSESGSDEDCEMLGQSGARVPGARSSSVPRVKWLFHLLSITVILTDGRKWQIGK